MISINKKYVVDKHGNPKEVIILFEDFKKIEELLGLDLNENVIADLKAGKRHEQSFMLHSFTMPQETSGSLEVQEKTDSQQLTSLLYALRNEALAAKTIAQVQALEKQFNDIDKQSQAMPLTDDQKALLADTERIIKESLRRAIIKIEKEMEGDKRIEEEKIKLEKEALLRDLLGETAVIEESKSVIILIENNKVEKDILTERFVKEGYDVLSYDSYAIPLTTYQDNNIDLLLLDDDIIGDKTGIDYVINIKSQARDHSIQLPPIVVHTNNSMSWTNSMFKRQGLTKKAGVFVIPKRDLEKNILFINQLIDKK